MSDITILICSLKVFVCHFTGWLIGFISKQDASSQMVSAPILLFFCVLVILKLVLLVLVLFATMRMVKVNLFLLS